MKKVILVRYGEILLKGLNRSMFENKLISNIKKAVKRLGAVDIQKSQARIYVVPREEDYDFDEAIVSLTKVFGIVSISPVWRIKSDYNIIEEFSLEMAKDLVKRKGHLTFKVETKRGDKKFPMDSPQISRELGAFLLKNIPDLSVDVINPQFTLYVEVREFTYIYSEIIPAFCGMPSGTNGKAVLLLSGGIDIPAAGWMVAKRCVEIDAVHFYSYPYTSERAKEKVIELAKILAQYCHKINLHIIPFTDIQMQIYERCPHEELTIIMRRIMMKVAEKIANKVGAVALVTGESIGQVASQTIQALSVTNAAVDMPVFRPLIGMDKNEIVQIAKKIGTYETSILPYEDCCTVFVAKHPVTKPKLQRIKVSESILDIDQLVNKAVEGAELMVITAEQ